MERGTLSRFSRNVDNISGPAALAAQSVKCGLCACGIAIAPVANTATGACAESRSGRFLSGLRDVSGDHVHQRGRQAVIRFEP
jgi:hypothetical protein